MQLIEVKNDIAKIIYNPVENNLLPADFLMIEDFNQKLISQIVNIETTDNSNNNLAELKISLMIDEDDNLSYYNGYIPSKTSKIIYIKSDEIIELIKDSDNNNIYLGNLVNHPDCFVNPSINFVNDRLYIQSDRDDETYTAVSNLINELQNKNQKIIILDFDGKYKNINAQSRITITKDFKLPLNIDAFNTILETDTKECPIEDKAVIQSIVLELREYLNTLKDKFIPFNMFKNAVNEEFSNNPVSGLMLLRNKLWKYSQDNVFAENISQFNFINSLLSNNLVVIDAALLEEKWHKLVIQTILSLTDTQAYLILSLNDIQYDKKIINLLYNHNSILPIIITAYNNEYSQVLKLICKNRLLCKPSKNENDGEYSILLNKMHSDEMILYGETTLYLPLLVKLNEFKKITAEDIVENEIKKDVDKLLYSNSTVIPQDTIIGEVKKPEIKEETRNIEVLNKDEIVQNEIKNEDVLNETADNARESADDVTDSDLDFLDEDIFYDDEAVNNENHKEDNSGKENAEIFESENQEENTIEIIQDSSESTISDEEKEEEIKIIDSDNTDENPEIISDNSNESEIQEIGRGEQKSEIADIDDVIINIKNNYQEKETSSEKVNKVQENQKREIPVYETDQQEISVENLPFKVGDKVYHPKHGMGVVEGFANYSNKILFCQIEFENVGRRILDPRVSGLEKVS